MPQHYDELLVVKTPSADIFSEDPQDSDYVRITSGSGVFGNGGAIAGLRIKKDQVETCTKTCGGQHAPQTIAIQFSDPEVGVTAANRIVALTFQRRQDDITLLDPSNYHWWDRERTLAYPFKATATGVTAQNVRDWFYDQLNLLETGDNPQLNANYFTLTKVSTDTLLLTSKLHPTLEKYYDFNVVVPSEVEPFVTVTETKGLAKNFAKWEIQAEHTIAPPLTGDLLNTQGRFQPDHVSDCFNPCVYNIRYCIPDTKDVPAVLVGQIPKRGVLKLVVDTSDASAVTAFENDLKTLFGNNCSYTLNCTLTSNYDTGTDLFTALPAIANATLTRFWIKDGTTGTVGTYRYDGINLINDNTGAMVTITTLGANAGDTLIVEGKTAYGYCTQEEVLA